MQPDHPPKTSFWPGRVMAFIFHQLYHPFAGCYDLVAFLVSLGRWNRWVAGIVPFIGGPRVLEIGSGPGHLQKALSPISGLAAVGIDESRQMLALAARRLRKSDPASPGRLARARAEQLPFANASFDDVVATFPTPYIFQPETILQIARVLKPGGRLSVLLAARQPQDSLPARIIDALYRITSQAPPGPEFSAQITQRFREGGLTPELTWEMTPSGKLLLLIAKKPKSDE